MIRLLTFTVALGILASPALAQEGGGWAFAFGAATDNRSKDASKSDGDSYVWAEAEWSDAWGLAYAGPALETIDAGGSRLELSPNVGLRPQWGGFDWDLNAAYKYRVGADDGYDHEAWEFTADVERSVGPAAARLRLQHSPDGTGSTRAWTWVSARLGWDFTPRLSGLVEVGRREQDAGADYVGWSAGFRYAAAEAVELELRYHATDADDAGRQYEDALVAGVAFAF